MILNPTFQIQKEVVRLLNTDDALKALLGDPIRIYEELPVDNDLQIDVELPLIQYENSGNQESGGTDCLMFTHTIIFNCWDGGEYEGTNRLQQISMGIYNLLHWKEELFNISPFHLVFFQWTGNNVLQTTDGQAWLLQSTYQATTQKVD